MAVLAGGGDGSWGARSPVVKGPGNALVWIVFLATTLRLASALYQGDSVTALPGIWDQLSYDSLARRVIHGHGFSFAEGHWPATRAGEPTAHWSYLYTLYLAAVYAALGEHPLAARIVQALLSGVLHTWLTWRVGCRIFGRQAGLLAAVASAVYVYFIYYAGGLLTESLYFVGILWTLDLATQVGTGEWRRDGTASRGPRVWYWVRLGLAVGITALLRQVFLVFLPFLCLWLIWAVRRAEPCRRALPEGGRSPRLSTTLGVSISLVIVLAFILPWTIRNYRAFGTFTLLNTNAGFALFWSNHPIHGTSFRPLLDGAEAYAALIPAELDKLDEARLDKALLVRGLGFIVEDPVRFLLLSLSRSVEYFKFWPSDRSRLASNLARVASFGVFLPFMVYGVLLSYGLLRNPPRPHVRSQILLLYIFAAVYTGVHLASWTLVRYRLPVDTVLIILAGLGLSAVVARVRRSSRLAPQQT